MGSLIGISNPQNQLRQNHTLLLLSGGISTILGLFLWSAPPFIWSNTKDRVGVVLRYLALASSLGCGVAAVATGYQLQRIAPLIKAIETAERNDFLDQLASSQYVQQQQWQQLAASELQPVSTGNSSVSSLVTETGNSDTERVTSVTNDSVTDTVTTEKSTATPSAIEGYKPIYLAIAAMKQEGISDTKIIKEVLKQEGRNFETGQKMLEAILQLGQQEGW